MDITCRGTKNIFVQLPNGARIGLQIGAVPDIWICMVKCPDSWVFENPCKLCFLFMDSKAIARIDKISAVVINKKFHGISHWYTT